MKASRRSTPTHGLWCVEMPQLLFSTWLSLGVVSSFCDSMLPLSLSFTQRRWCCCCCGCCLATVQVIEAIKESDVDDNQGNATGESRLWQSLSTSRDRQARRGSVVDFKARRTVVVRCSVNSLCSCSFFCVHDDCRWLSVPPSRNGERVRTVALSLDFTNLNDGQGAVFTWMIAPIVAGFA